MNNTKTFLLLTALTAVLLLIGGLIGGRVGILFALIFAGIMNLGAYWYSDKIVLSMYKAYEAPQSSPIYRIVERLSQNAQLPMPKVYLIKSDAPNAFATGRNPGHASVAATTGLVSMLSNEELSGVMAHELSHVLHRDTLISAVTATIAGAISGIANWFMWLSFFGGHDEEGSVNPIVGILLMILAPIAAMLIQMAISRSREFEADRVGAQLCNNPLWLASALEKLEASKSKVTLNDAQTHPATAHLFIVNPLQGERLAELFATHPLTSERIRRLKAMVGE